MHTQQVIYWPLKLAMLLGALFIAWRIWGPRESFYGLTTKGFKMKPYWLMLAFMLPLVAAASTQADFLSVYPKPQHVAFLQTAESTGWHKLLYELSYGIGLFRIELFFRGFLVLAFAKWAGKEAICPWPFFIAPFILENHWANAFLLILEE